MARKPIQAAGGIVVREGGRPLIAIVQRTKDDHWVLPRGKLKLKERPKEAARREVFEETGHRVDVHEFVGAMVYRAQGRPKLVQFWHMRADAEPSRDLMRDIAKVIWLPLPDAVKKLSYPLEKLFLRQIGRTLVRRKHKARNSEPDKKAGKKPDQKSSKKPRKDSGNKSGKNGGKKSAKGNGKTAKRKSKR